MLLLGEKLRELRLNKGWSQQQVASLLGISKSRLSSYELNIHEPNLDMFRKMAALYNVSSDFLLELQKGQYVDVTGLTPQQVTIIQSIIDSYR